jgi:ubiquinone/menaquinone biosynthesis C-methylase UbiE
LRVLPKRSEPDPTRASAELWEAAYLRFETAPEETRKFRARLLQLGATDWPRDARIVELCCGRGSGLIALDALGFTRVEGVDLSRGLLRQSVSRARCYQADVRQLPVAAESRDVLIVQGGLHHIGGFPSGVREVFDEARRVLVSGGRFAIVEPWPTPFLVAAYRAALFGPTRRLWHKLDALGAMIEHEWAELKPWLEGSDQILALYRERFDPELLRTARGMLMSVGRKRR